MKKTKQSLLAKTVKPKALNKHLKLIISDVDEGHIK